MSDPNDDLARLVSRIAGGMPAAPVEATPRRIPKPVYLLSVDDPDATSIVLIVRTGPDGVPRATIALPKWHELPEGWDGPHEMHVAIALADDYAHEYGYSGIAIDIESSQLWDPAWGSLSSPSDGFDAE